MFLCKRCGYTSKYKCNMKSHFSRKKSCKPLLNDISFEDLKLKFNKINKKASAECQPNVSRKKKSVSRMSAECQPKTDTIYECEFCNKIFKHRQSKFKHLKSCKEKKQSNDKSLIEFFSEKFNEMEEKHEREKTELRSQIEKLLEKVGNNNTTNNNRIQTQIVLNNFGKENIEYINSNYINKLIQQGIYGAVPKIIKYLHFNPEHPENRNVKITNKKESWAQIWNNDKWILKNKKLVINDIVDKGYNIIDDKKNPQELNNNKNSKLNDFQKKYDTNDKNTHKYLNKEVEMLILNESKIKYIDKYKMI